MPATKTARRRPTARRSAPKRSSRRQSPITPGDLARFHLLGAPAIAPDGSRIVFVEKHVGEKNAFDSNLWTVDTDGTAPPERFTSGNRDGRPQWAPDGERVAFVRASDPARPQIHLIAADGGEARILTDLPEGTIGAFRFSPDGRTIALAFREQDPGWTTAAIKERKEHGLHDPPRVLDDWWYRLDGDGWFNEQRHHLYLVDVESGVHEKLYDRDTLGYFSFDWSPDSRRLAVTTNRDRKALIRAWKDEILVIDVTTGKARPVPGLPDGPKDHVRWSPDGKRLAYAGRTGKDSSYSTENLELWTCDPARGAPRCVTGREDYCLMAVALTDTAEVEFGPCFRWLPDGKRLLVKIGHHGETHVASIRAAGGRLTFLTSGAADFDLGNLSADGRSVALTKGTTDRLAEIHVGRVGATAIETTALTDFNGPLLKTRALAKVSSRWVKTPDGTRVQVWEMFPPGHARTSRKKYPAVMEIHGGPHAQYGVGFFHEFQVLAAAGYAVFYSNPRGSKGYGRDHCHAIHGKWGTADWTDIQAVTAHMSAHPNVDAKRMGIMGGSYGGYMTNWAIGHTRVFRAAITDRCVSNLVSMGGTSDFPSEPDHYFPGNFWDRPEERWEQSPLKYLGNAKTPTLIIHSEGDLRCNVEQAEQVFVALKLLNVPTRFVRYPRSTSHGMSRGGPPDMRLHRLGQILEWWERYLKR